MSSVQTKYIIFSTPEINGNLNNIPSEHNGIYKLPIIFPNHIDHKVMALAMRGLKLKPVSAGFCYIGKDGYYLTTGRSETLNLDSLAEDDTIINCYLSGG